MAARRTVPTTMATTKARRAFHLQKPGTPSWRSGLEGKVGAELEARGVKVYYEVVVVSYEKPAQKSRYTADFFLPNGIIIETKGWFVTADRKKHKLIKEQHPNLDIRFVFSNPNAKIGKLSKTTYAKWCDDNGFKWAKASIPDEWLDEPTDRLRLKAAMEFMK